MNRRQYLAGSIPVTGSALGGCLASITPASSKNPQRQVSLGSVATVPDQARLSLEAALINSAVGPDQTARLRVTTTNEGERRGISIGTDTCCLFNRAQGGSAPRGLWLHRPEKADYIDRKGQQWTRDAPSDKPRSFTMEGCLPRVYAAGESVTNEYLVWDDYQTAGYLDPGTYRFEERVQVRAVDGETDEDRTRAPVETAFTWGFDLTVERAE